jgi:hypothetical protein
MSIKVRIYNRITNSKLRIKEVKHEKIILKDDPLFLVIKLILVNHLY